MNKIKYWMDKIKNLVKKLLKYLSFEKEYLNFI